MTRDNNAIMLLKDLIAELKSEISGNFSHTITSLCKSPAERDADELRKAMKVSVSACHFFNFHCDNFRTNTVRHKT